MPLRTILLLMLAALTLQSGTLSTISPLTQAINTVTNYTWQFTFSSSTLRSDANLTFPSACTLSGSTQVWIGANQLNTTISSNTIIITSSSLLYSSVSLTVTNVKNPYSAIPTYSFSVTTTLDGTFSLSQGSQVIYQAGQLQTNLWSFSLCTQQPGSNLTVSVSITNPVPNGTNYFYIGYANWVNHYIKSLLYGVSGQLTAYVSLDNGTIYNPVTTITFDTSKISITYPQTANLTTGSTLKFIVMGVQSPPTEATPTTSSYYVATADSSGFQIDMASSCTVSTTCVTSYSNGLFSNTIMPVNSNYLSPQVGIAATPIITLAATDTVEMSFSPLANFNNCNQMRIWRNINNPIQAALSSTSTFALYSIQSSSNTPNSDSSNNITISLSCTSVTIPNSQTPVPLTFKFKRNSSTYLQVTANMLPQATVLASNLSLLPSTTQMTKTAVTYTFSLLTSQPLGISPAIKLYFPTDITVPSSPACAVSISTGSANSPVCSLNATNNALTLNFSAQNTITASTVITVTVPGLTNPATPTTDLIGVETYYDSSASTSRVQYSFPGFSTTFTGITNYPATFLPASLTVFSLTPTTITLNTSILLPSGCTVYVQYPSDASNIAISSTPLMVSGFSNGGSPSASASNNSFSLTTTSDITPNSTLVLSANLTSPPSMGSFNYVVVRIYSGSTLYLESSSSMFLYVNSVLSLPISIVAATPKTGALSGYTLTLTLSVPHPASFLVQIQLPGDLNYTGVGSTCSGNCTALTASNSTFLTVTASNSQPNSTSAQISLVLSATFTNARHIGTGLPWNITTKTISPSNTISFTSQAPSLSIPNLLTVTMLTDDYYQSNNNTVKISYAFTNNLMDGDYIEMQISTDTYKQYTTVNCSLSFGTCSKANTSTNALLVVRIIPNLTAVINKTLTVWVQGMISGSNKTMDTVNVSTYTSGVQMIDTGNMLYVLSCKDNTSDSILNNCRTCYSNHTCIDCYIVQGFYLNGSTCVSNCGLATLYANNNTGICEPCINNCQTCASATYCISCITNYYLMDNNTCTATCSPNGFINSTLNGLLYCKTCYGGGACLKCTSASVGACTICVNTSVLSNGICQTSCANASMYASGGVCSSCDISCATCTSGGNGGCTRCAINYYNYTNFCLNACPSGTAPNTTSGLCTCDLPCSKCQTSTTYCTACVNSSLFVSDGSCLSACPAMNYLSGTTCYLCGTACSNCSATTCFTCIGTYYLYSNNCYSDCKQIGPQYDVSGSSCVQCPDGCSTCKTSTCTSCQTNYTLQSNAQCVQTCLLTNSCSLTGATVLPLPGLISVVLWAVIVLVIKFILKKNYLPYSLILFTAVVQLVLVIATLASSPALSSLSIARLLTPSDQQRTTIRALLGLALALNYIANIVHLILFIKYIKPLVTNPRQIDVISHVVVLAVGTLTNYRFCLIAYAKLFPKPAIHVENASKLTPLHILSIISLFLDIIPLAATIVALYNEQPKTNLFMLALDLLIIILLNTLITIWFVSCTKPEQYYEDDIKKYHMEDHHNATDANLPNDRSKTNMVANDTFHFADQDIISQKHEKDSPANYTKLTTKVSKVSVHGLPDSTFGQGISDDSDIQDLREQSVIPVRAFNSKKANPDQDVNFEEGLKSKVSNSSASIPSHQKIELGTTLKSEGKNSEDMLASKKHSSPRNFSKNVASARKNYLRPERDIQEVQEEADIPDIPQKNDGRESVFDRPKEKIARPKRVGTEKKTPANKKQGSSIQVFNKEEGKKIGRYVGTDKQENGREERRKSVDQPLKVMKKNDKVGYFQSDAFESNAEEDIETIIKQKVWQGTVKKENKKFLEQQGHESNSSETGYEQISPSWFNVQNQRIELSDFGDRQSQP